MSVEKLSFCPSRYLYQTTTEPNPKANHFLYKDVSENRDTPKSSILIGFSIINHPFWGTPIFGNTYL